METNHYPSDPTGALRRQTCVSLALLALMATLLFTELRSPSPKVHSQAAQPRLVAARGELSAEEQHAIALFKTVSPSVVHITNLAGRKNLFSLKATELSRDSGSGFVWDANGYIVTNYHVIADSQSLRVDLADQSRWKARLVGSDPDKDIAVIKVDAPQHLLPAIGVGTSSDLEVGQRVFAIGNPFGYDQTLTAGLVSGLGREITSASDRPIKGVIQTDAPINPGNSGGPLLDSSGHVIGMNTAILSPSGAYAGIGFAVPIDCINRIVPAIIRGEVTPKPRLGVTAAEDHLVRRLGLQGVLILSISPNTTAADAGFRETKEDNGKIVLGDLIVAIDGAPVRTSDDLFRIIDTHKVGDVVQITIVRDGQKMDLKVKLEPMP